MKILKGLYAGLFLTGILAAIYLYGTAFNEFSETELVRLSYGWIAAIVFGTHGFIASELNEIIASGAATTPREALTVRRTLPGRSFISKMASIMLWSFYLITANSDRNPLLTAVLATVLWVGALIFFFETVFPEL